MKMSLFIFFFLLLLSETKLTGLDVRGFKKKTVHSIQREWGSKVTVVNKF